LFIFFNSYFFCIIKQMLKNVFAKALQYEKYDVIINCIYNSKVKDDIVFQI